MIPKSINEKKKKSKFFHENIGDSTAKKMSEK